MKRTKGNPAPFTPKLKWIDLSKGDGHKHPDIKADGKTHYLAVIHGALFSGTFTKQHYGLNFDDGWGASGHQFDTPGTNASDWHALWELEDIHPVLVASSRSTGARRAAARKKYRASIPAGADREECDY